MVLDKSSIEPIIFDQRFYDSIVESDITANVDGKEIVGEARAEQCTLRDRRNPITLETRLEIRINDEEFRSFFFSVIEVFGGDRLIVGEIGAYEDEEVRADPVGV